jgi:hypothetical protein
MNRGDNLMGAGIRNKSKTIRAAALFFGLLAALLQPYP